MGSYMSSVGCVAGRARKHPLHFSYFIFLLFIYLLVPVTGDLFGRAASSGGIKPHENKQKRTMASPPQLNPHLGFHPIACFPDLCRSLWK